MLDRAPRLRNRAFCFLGALVALCAASCQTTKEPPRLVDDPDAKQESVLPWNKQQKWEGQQGALGGIMGEDRPH